MKRFIAAVAIICTIFSCTKVIETKPIEIILSETEAVVLDPSGVYTFEIECSDKWFIATNYPEWVDVSPLEGEGNESVTVSLEANDTGTDRIVSLTIGGGEIPQHISLRQPAATLSCSQTDYAFEHSSTQELEVSVTSNTTWSVETPAWCRAEPASGVGNGKFTISLLSAGMFSPEEVKIVYAGGQETFLVAQYAAVSPDAPSLVFPKADNTAVSLYPDFQWTPSRNGVTYTAYIGTSPTDVSTPLVMNPNTSIMASVREALKKETTYYWRVVGDDGTCSQTARFVTGKGSYVDGEYRFYQQNVQKGENGAALQPVNIVITGDGFIESDYVDGGWFDQMANQIAEHLVSAEPTSSMRDYFRISKVCAVSPERGITMGTMKINTKFGMKIGGGNTFIENTLGNWTLFWSYIKQVPGIDDAALHNTVMICLVNVDFFGGVCSWLNNGRSMVRIAIHQPGSDALRRLALHESIGHGLAKLADEYLHTDDGTLEGQAETDLLNQQERYGWYHNVSASETNTPWEMFRGRAGYEAVGAYEGTFVSYKYDCWKSEPNSLMAYSESTGTYFNAISRYRIYQRVKTISGETPTLEDFLEMDEKGRNQDKPYIFPIPAPYIPPVSDGTPHWPVVIEGEY